MSNNSMMLKNNYINIILVAVVLLGSSCKKEYDSIETTDKAIINDYIAKNNITDMSPDDSGFYYRLAQATTNTVLKNSDSVFYDFNIKGISGAFYQDFKPFRPNQNYVGYVSPEPFRKVMLQLRRGGSAEMIIPSYLAFGKNGSGSIPANEVIIVTLKTSTYAKRHLFDDDLISKFNVQNNLTLTKDQASKCYYKVITPGTGTEAISRDSRITAKYTVRYLDGTVIPQSSDEITDALINLYKGWQLNLSGRLTSGGKMRLVIPSAMAGVSSLEPLDFDIEIVSVTNN